MRAAFGEAEQEMVSRAEQEERPDDGRADFGEAEGEAERGEGETREEPRRELAVRDEGGVAAAERGEPDVEEEFLVGEAAFPEGVLGPGELARQAALPEEVGVAGVVVAVAADEVFGGELHVAELDGDVEGDGGGEGGDGEAHGRERSCRIAFHPLLSPAKSFLSPFIQLYPNASSDKPG